MSQDPDRTPETISPVNPLPPVVVAMFLMVIGIEATVSLAARGIIGGPAGIGWRLEAVQSYAFSGLIFDWMWDNGQWPAEHLIRFVSYLFVHTSFTHALFVCVMLLALGKMVGEVFTGLATLSVFVLSGAIGALAYAVLLDDQAPLVGGFPGVYGLIGAFTYLLWLKLGELGAQQVRAFTLIGFLMGIQLVFGLIFGVQSDWVADVVGFATGFCMSFIVSPGGFSRLREKMKRD
ncbi:rhomboid family intramembrane serine protease [Planktotalea arctica]|uniref:rhomboid family intramembrane serine protease n=1 Tax=Planktotalea arctica TaxID=1481893 RepID=UPI000A176D63|nr:rhomboid family intramembrane serine protease [Planktotalea arctica]